MKPCRNARERIELVAGKSRRTYGCKPDCPICRGSAKVEVCPTCDGAGLLRGERCKPCGASGQVPAEVPSTPYMRV